MGLPWGQRWSGRRRPRPMSSRAVRSSRESPSITADLQATVAAASRRSSAGSGLERISSNAAPVLPPDSRDGTLRRSQDGPSRSSLKPAVANAPVTMEMALSPVAPASATIADVKITDGANVLPSNVSFAQQVRPIFERRGCETCHSGSGPGRDLGNLTLDGGNALIYRELVQEEGLLTTGNNRIDVAMPEKSLVLTMPSAEDPPDRHPNVTFTGPNDPDYELLLVWIREGARDN